MNSEEILISALAYEKKIRDLYVEAQDIVDDHRGKQFFKTMASDEQSHVDFLEYSLEKLKKDDQIDTDKLGTVIPSKDDIDRQIEVMKEKIPEKMLGDIKRVLNNALKLEVETSAFYLDAINKSDGSIKDVLEKFYKIEQRHVDVVQIELDYASNNGYWLDFMEIDMEY